MEQRDDDPFLRVDRRAFAVGNLHDESDERDYWLKLTPQERLRHVERLRRINYGTRATERLQKVIAFTRRETRNYEGGEHGNRCQG